MAVKRYSHYKVEACNGIESEMELDKDGEWVKYEDFHKAIRAWRKTAEALKKAEDTISRLRSPNTSGQ